MNTRQKVLEEALKCVNGEREKQYGNPEDNFSRIADFWGLYLTTLFEDTGVVVELDPKDVAIMMILFKIARSLGDQDKLDNYVDMIGYAACGAEIFENEEDKTTWPKTKEEAAQALKEELDNDILKNLDIADECKECDYTEKCIGTGVCLKEKEKELLDNKDPYSYARNKLVNYASIKSSEEHVPLDNLKELSDYLNQAVKDCVENGKRFLECYREIDEMFTKYKNKNKPDNKQKDTCDHAVDAAYMSKWAIETHKFVEDNRLSMDFDFEKSPKGRDIFNDAARAFIAGIGNGNVKITTFEAPKDWYLYDVFMNETGQIIARFNTRKTKELTGIPSCDECL